MHHTEIIIRNNYYILIIREGAKGRIVYESAPQRSEASARKQVLDFLYAGPNRGSSAGRARRESTIFPVECWFHKSINDNRS